MNWVKYGFYLPLILVTVGCASSNGNMVLDDGASGLNQSLALHAWVQVGPEGVLSVRAISDKRECPTLKIDGKELAMAQRASPTDAFPVLSCEATLPATVRSASLGGMVLPLPKADPERIIFFGDTGCRIKKGAGGKIVVQNCNDPQQWPFAHLMEAIAALKPDLVVHVGDYHYREAACPQGDKGCEGAQSGDNWLSWRQDFFSPAQPLMNVAPWIVLRGNHELCARSGSGWFQFLDPYPFKGCSDVMDPYRVPLGTNQDLAVIDAAAFENIGPSLAKLKLKPDTMTWLALHRPILTPGADDEASGQPPSVASWQSQGTISAVIVGHLHLVDFNVFTDDRPPELIIGNGGTRLDQHPDLKKGLLTAILEKKDITSFVHQGFGFVIFDRIAKDRWAVSARDQNDQPVFDCMLNQKPHQKGILTCDKT